MDIRALVPLSTLISIFKFCDMSNYKIHILGYIVSAALLLAGLSYYKIGLQRDIIISGNLIGILYSILPDVDVPSSKIRILIERISIAIIFFSLIFYIFTSNSYLLYTFVITVLFLLFLHLVRHREIFHNIGMGFILSIPFYIINPYLAGFAFLGFLSHIAIDRILS